MKITKKAYITAIATLVAIGNTVAAQAAQYDPATLVLLKNQVAHSIEQGEKPVVIFDLDDTLINTRERNLRIIKDYTNDPDVVSKYPLEVSILKNITLTQVRYLLKDTLQDQGIQNAKLITEIQEFWLPRFFSNEYCANDLPTQGAVEFANILVNEGATVVYLTGRDIPRMGAGTEANLQSSGFPLDGVHSVLLLKPYKEIDDLAFKIKAFDQIAGMGKVLAGFENEPANLNAMQTRFPEALSIFLDTIHSPKLDIPNPNAHWIQNFDLPLIYGGCYEII